MKKRIWIPSIVLALLCVIGLSLSPKAQADATRPAAQFSKPNAPASGTAASIVQTAAGVNARNVADSITFSATSSAAVTAAVVNIVLRDGGSGAGTILWQGTVALPTAGAAGVQEIPVTSVPFPQGIPGTANTAMTLEYSAGVTGVNMVVTLNGHIVYGQ